MTSEARTLLQTVLEGAAAGTPDPIVTFVDTGSDGTLSEETRSFAQLLDAGQRVAGALWAAGMADGDAFAIIMRNHPEFVEAMVGSEIARTVFVPIDPRTRGEKLAYMLRFARCKGAIVSADIVAHLSALRSQLPDLDWIWVIGDAPATARAEPLGDVLARAARAVNLTPAALDAPMQMLFTSGTTGDPKAILAPHARFAAIAAMGPLIGLLPSDKLYTGLSLTHANAQLITLGNGLAHRLPVVISRQFTKSRLWEIMARHGCTTFNLLGGMATAIYAEPPGGFDRAHQVRFVLSAGMPAAMWRGFEERFGVKVFEFFGTAEGGLTLNPPGVGPIGSIGKPPPGSECEILDDEGNILGPEQPGEICFRNADGSTVPVTYFGNPEASRAKTRGGWFHSGDIGWKDADGWVFFSHRDGQSIRRNGDFIDPRPIETTIAALPGVADVYVYGVMTQANTPGEKEVVAAVVPQADCDPVGLIAACARQLGSASAPSFVQLLDAIPKTASEKPQDRHLVALLETPDARIFDSRGPARIALQTHERKAS